MTEYEVHLSKWLLFIVAIMLYVWEGEVKTGDGLKKRATGAALGILVAGVLIVVAAAENIFHQLSDPGPNPTVHVFVFAALASLLVIPPFFRCVHRYLVFPFFWAAVVMAPLAIFGPVGGVRFWVVAATFSFLWWWGNMRFITGWGEGRPLMSRRARAAVSLCLAGLCSWAFTIHPNPDRLNQLMFTACCITVVLLFWRGWANRWFPIQGAQPIVVQAPV